MSRLRIPSLPIASLALALVLSACGGGGGGGSSATATPAPTLTNFDILGSASYTNVPAQPNAALCPSTPEQTSLLAAPTTSSAAVYMDVCPITTTTNGTSSTSGVANIPYISVYVCAPGSTTNCAWIDHIAVDTGSEGLRLLASAVPNSLLTALPAVTTANLVFASPPPATGPVGECYDFVSSFFWGGVYTADIKFGGTAAYPNAPNTQLAATGIKLQILNDTNMPASPPSGNNSISGTQTTCGSSAGSVQENSAAQIGANGLIGIGLFQEDCHGNCTSGLGAANYYVLTGNAVTGTLKPISPSASSSMQNPIAALPSPYNAGTTFQLNAVHNIIAATKNNNTLAQPSAFAGSLSFGPAPSNVHQLIADPVNGYIQSTVLGTTYSLANLGGTYLDSGSNALFFSNSGTTSAGTGLNLAGVATCPGNNVFACVTAATSCSIDGITTKCVSLSPTSMTSVATAAAPSPASYSVPVDPANYPLAVFDANTTFNTFSPAVDGLALVSSTNAGIFDWGLPFFFGRTLYFGIGNPAIQQNPYYGLGF